jgi:hypothetical protein
MRQGVILAPLPHECGVPTAGIAGTKFFHTQSVTVAAMPADSTERG